MALSDPLRQDLRSYPLSSALKSELLNSLFGCELAPGDFAREPSLCASYFEYYQKLCIATLHDGRHPHSIKTHREIVEIVRLLQDPNSTREAIKQSLRPMLSTPETDNGDDILGDAIDLAARLGLMILVGNFRHVLLAGQRALSWKDSRLDKLLAQNFTKDTFLYEQHVKLEKLFNARNLERIAGLRIVWTSNLADHLRMQQDDTKVSIFHHASFLEFQKESQIFPRGLIEETLQTLALLLPQYDKASVEWFQKQQKKLVLDSKAIKCRHLTAEDRQIENFHYWHDRLVILKQVFDEAEPKSIQNWWRDRRKPVQWYNFWIAVALIAGLTFVFGLIQCIEGGLQVYKAYHPT